MIPVVVREVLTETADIKLFRLARADGGSLPAFAAGAHIDVSGPTGIVRQYSLCGPPDRTEDYLIGVKRELQSRGGSAALHDRVRAGDELAISEPRNLFQLSPGVPHSVLLAAGIGITPLLSMAHALHGTGSVFELHYFARSAARAAFAADLERSAFADRVRPHFGVPLADQPALLAEIMTTVDRSDHVYTCGPKEFMRGVTELAARVVSEDHIHFEHFQALEPPAAAGDAFELELDTGEVFTIPSGRSIVDVLADNGIDIPTSCREGICGTCVMTVLDGTPDHRDNCLTRKEKEAGDQMAACVSRSRTPRIVVEL